MSLRRTSENAASKLAGARHEYPFSSTTLAGFLKPALADQFK